MRVIVADDENLVRAVVVNTIPFDQLGMTLVGEASNGIEALELCRELQPDILVTDIAMPGLTGLELIKEAKVLLPDMKIVIISGYSDFNYAKQAIRLGVNDYVLKPVDENEITNVLFNIKELIFEEKKQKEEDIRIKINFQKAQPLMQEKILNDIIRSNTFTDDFIRKSLISHGIGLKYPYFRLALFLLDPTLATYPGKDAAHLVKLISRFSKKYLNGILFQRAGSDNEFVCIINHKNARQDDLEGESRFMEREFNLFFRLIHKKSPRMASVGLSQASNLVKSLPALYEQAINALEERFWKGSGKLFRFMPPSISEELSLSRKNMDFIVFQLRMSNEQPAFDYINTLSKQLSSAKNKPMEVRDLFWTFIQSLIENLDISLNFIRKESAFLHIHPYEKLNGIDSMEILRQHMIETVRRIQKYYLEEHAVNDLNSIENAMNIIRENLTRDITLEQIARCVHLAPTYFSILFKNKTGMSYIDYKTKLRMDMARNLLETTCYNLNEISSQVGYSDQKYFSWLYKKYTGTYPHEHRRKGSS